MIAVVQRALHAVTAADFGMQPWMAFALLGLVINRAVDILRNAADKWDRVPKAAWLLVAWGLGIVVAFVIASSNSLEAFFGLDPLLDHSAAVGAILAGIGFGSVGGFWHELMSWFSGAPATTPKGLRMGPKR